MAILEGKTYFSEETENLVDLLFPPERRDEILDSLRGFCEWSNSYKVYGNVDRFCFAILKLSVRRGKGRINAFYKAMQLAKTDYRDLLVAAGFGNSTTAHAGWAKKIQGTHA